MSQNAFTIRLRGRRAEYFQKFLDEMNSFCERRVSAQEVFEIMVDVMMENSSILPTISTIEKDPEKAQNMA